MMRKALLRGERYSSDAKFSLLTAFVKPATKFFAVPGRGRSLVKMFHAICMKGHDLVQRKATMTSHTVTYQEWLCQ